MEKKEGLTFWLFSLAVTLVVLLSFLDYFIWKIIIFPNWLIAISLAILIFGYLLRLYLKHLLGKQFNIYIVIRKDHKLIKKGPYRYIRHPLYTSTILIFLGLAGTLSSVIGVIATVMLIIPAILLRIKREEYYLEKKFGKQYKNYKKSTKSLIPPIW